MALNSSTDFIISPLPTMSPQTSSEYKTWYLSYLSTCQRYDFDKLSAYVHDDFILQGQQIGLSGFIKNLEDAVHGWPGLRWVPRKIAVDLDQGPMICVWFDMYFNKAGEEGHFQEVAFYTVRDGRMAEVEVMFWGPKPKGGPQESDGAFERSQ